ncbi:MAG: translation elongation factor Ts [Kiritimatiellae bacterium]|nr:translation elongation factor Ts [Kiritimatiellia bacterium]MBO5940937.1 translation elongation factor Ts [Kiritimatiellia bacterium]
MEITIAMIKELREATAAGMGACKEALQASNGDMKEAVKYLREKGLAVAAKRVDKESKQGIIALAEAADKKTMALAEVNCETDFVAKTEAFIKFVDDAAKVALEGNDIEATLKDDYQMLLTKTGENVKIRRSERYVLDGAGVLSGYIHMGGKIGVLVELACEKDDPALADAAHMLCLQIAANAPKYINPEDVPQDEIDAEIEIKLNALKEQKGKLPPEQALVGIKKGMAAKYCTQVCLVKQDYVADGEITVEKYLDGIAKNLGSAITVKRFARLQLGA